MIFIESDVANDQVIGAYLIGYTPVEIILGILIYAKPNHQICLFNQKMIDLIWSLRNV